MVHSEKTLQLLCYYSYYHVLFFSFHLKSTMSPGPVPISVTAHLQSLTQCHSLIDSQSILIAYRMTSWLFILSGNKYMVLNVMKNILGVPGILMIYQILFQIYRFKTWGSIVLSNIFIHNLCFCIGSNSLDYLIL